MSALPLEERGLPHARDRLYETRIELLGGTSERGGSTLLRRTGKSTAMLKVASFDIVFQEIPGEVTLALNLSNCPCHCPGCHSPHLWEDTGEELNESLLDDLIARYSVLSPV